MAAQPNYLELSDDELPDYLPDTEEEQQEAVTDEEEESSEPVDEEKEVSSEEESTEEEETTTPDIFAGSTKTITDSEEEEEEEPSEPEVEESPSLDSIDYKSEYLKLIAPFRANGKEMQVTNIDDARRLMQMGANYNKKMEGMKPHLKILRTLEKYDLLDPEKINFLINLEKKDPATIAKYMRDGQIDPLSIELDGETAYNPQSHIVSDNEVNLDEVLDKIRETPTFQRTISELGNKWDEQSKKILMENPVLIEAINEHVETGIYDKIRNVVEQERMFGRLSGLPDIVAYKAVGDAMQANGEFNKPTKPTPPSKGIIQQKKKAAAPTKGTPRKVTQDFNPLAMSDAEFEKFSSSRFM